MNPDLTTKVEETFKSEGNLNSPEFIAFIQELTSSWAIANGYSTEEESPPPEKAELTEKARQIREVVLQGNGFEGYTYPFLRLLSIIMEEDLVQDFPDPQRQKEQQSQHALVELRCGIMIVPTSDEIVHNYPLDEPTWIICRKPYYAYGMRTDGTVGNLYPCRKDVSRPATPAEIREFFEKLTFSLGNWSKYQALSD